MAAPQPPIPSRDALKPPVGAMGPTQRAAGARTEAPPPTLPALNHSLLQHMASLDFAFVISDARAPDMPIIYASDRFFAVTGYGPSEVIGRNCRFLQGPDTERRKVMEIRDAIREDRCCQVCLVNYKKDGSTFLNQFFLSPIKDERSGCVTHYIGIQTDVSAAAAAGLLEAPGQLAEQQAAVALGTAAGCRACDMVMQQEQVQQQLQQQAQAPQEQPAGVSAVIRKEAVDAQKIQQAFGQAHEHVGGTLPASLLQSLLQVQQSYVLSDPRLPDCPIVHASAQFLGMTGYRREEVVGRNCRFLQGPGTDEAEVAKIREALAADPPRATTVTLLNYKKDGTPFWNALHVSPVRDADGRLEYFIGVQLDVTADGSSGGGGGGGKDAATAAAAAAAGGRDDTQDAAAAAAAAGACADEVPAPPGKLRLCHKMAHMTATGAVRVACRSLSGGAGGLRRSIDNQGLPARGYSRSLSSRRSGDSVTSGGGSGSFAAPTAPAAAAAAAAGRVGAGPAGGACRARLGSPGAGAGAANGDA